MKNPLERRKSPVAALATAMIVATIIAIFSSYCLSTFFLQAWNMDRSVPVGFGEALVTLAQICLDASTRISFSAWVSDPAGSLALIANHASQIVTAAGIGDRLVVVATACGVIVISAGLATFAVVWRATPREDSVKHLNGRKLILGGTARQKFVEIEKATVRVTGKGLELAPGMVMALERETRHLMLIGATGSGKTVILRSLIRQILLRGDRLIVHDTKGDFTETLPVDDLYLLAPHDERSMVWDIGADIRTSQDARELAAAFIQESKDPIWSGGAREIMAGCIIVLQAELGDSWGWEELALTLFADLVALHRVLSRHAPEAAGYIDLDQNNCPSRTAQSLIVTMRACVAATILPLASAWTKNPQRARFSILQWLTTEKPELRVLVLQRASHLPSLSKAWIGAFIRQFANMAVGPILPDDSQRRIWLALDEFAQLGNLEGFEQILEKGRSRGVCAILALQDTNQLNKIYGNEIAASWMSSISTKIICRLEAGSTASFVCNEIIGKRLVGWLDHSRSVAPWKADGSGGGSTHSDHIKHESLDVITPAFLESELGRVNSWPVLTIKALVVGVGSYVLEGVWPIESWPKLRPGMIPASWNTPKSTNSD